MAQKVWELLVYEEGKHPHGHAGRMLMMGFVFFSLASIGLKAFRQQLRKNARAKGFLGLNKIKGFARQVCQSSSARAARSGTSPFQHSQQNTCMYSNGGSSRETRSLLEEVLQQQRWESMLSIETQTRQWRTICLYGHYNLCWASSERGRDVLFS